MAQETDRGIEVVVDGEITAEEEDEEGMGDNAVVLLGVVGGLDELLRQHLFCCVEVVVENGTERKDVVTDGRKREKKEIRAMCYKKIIAH